MILLAFLIFSACGNNDSSSSKKSSQETSQNQDNNKNQDNNGETKIGSIKDFKFLDIADATSLGIAEKGTALAVASHHSENMIASLDFSGDGFAVASANVPSQIAPTTIVSQERKIYKVDASGKKLFLDYKPANTDTVINIPYEPKDMQQLGATWTAIRFKPTSIESWQKGNYEKYESTRNILDEVVFVNRANGSVYLLEKTGEYGTIIWDFKQGSNTNFYALKHVHTSRSELFRVNFAHETPTLSNPLPQSHRLSWVDNTKPKLLYTKNDAVIYQNSEDWKLYIKFVKENKLRAVSTNSSSLHPKYGCYGSLYKLEGFAISPDGNLLCSKNESKSNSYQDRSGQWHQKYAHTLTVVKLNLDSNALDGIATTETVVDFNISLKPNYRMNFYASDNRFIQLNNMLFHTAYTDQSKHLTLLKVYPTGDKKVYEFKDILGDWRKMDVNNWQKDGGSYRQFDDELYLFTKKADDSGYGMWKIDLTHLSAGATAITVSPKFETFTSFEKTWFTDDKKFLVQGVDDSGTSFIGRIDLTQQVPTMKRTEEFKNEVISLIKLK